MRKFRSEPERDKRNRTRSRRSEYYVRCFSTRVAQNGDNCFLLSVIRFDRFRDEVVMLLSTGDSVGLKTEGWEE